MASKNKAVILKKIPQGIPVPREHLTIEPVPYDGTASAPDGGVLLQGLYASLDPYMRGRMRSPEIRSYVSAFELEKPIVGRAIAKVLKSNNENYKESDLVSGFLPMQQYMLFNRDETTTLQLLQNPLGIEDLRVFLGALGGTGLTAYSSLHEIGMPKAGETIFVSAAAGAVGQIVGQLAKHEGLKVIGSVGSNEKLDFILKELNFDGGFNYKKEKPADALKRLAPEGIDIYYENVGGEHLEASLDAMKDFGRVVMCGMISEYNKPVEEHYPIRNVFLVVRKRITMRGFIVSDPGMGDKYLQEHQKNVQRWIKEGTFKAITSETVGIENAPEAFVGLFHGRNLGKVVLKY
jgi:NADPH-dependent curcumin reductase CurA